MVVIEAKSLRVDTDGQGGKVLPSVCMSLFVHASVRVQHQFCVLLS